MYLKYVEGGDQSAGGIVGCRHRCERFALDGNELELRLRRFFVGGLNIASEIYIKEYANAWICWSQKWEEATQ
ncbi:hypothetical protein OPV22_013015 [Ensete ventricosum]|uniref:Uncharacterized protein n=1 Tax=Ensete ventricosum TaxID=4639 RepID=A0AAV8QZW9_ENSVE|nr:hypothetical protein OPV22_013015 [Ensete ventricosum]